MKYYDMQCYHIISYHIISYDIILYYIILYYTILWPSTSASVRPARPAPVSSRFWRFEAHAACTPTSRSAAPRSASDNHVVSLINMYLILLSLSLYIYIYIYTYHNIINILLLLLSLLSLLSLALLLVSLLLNDASPSGGRPAAPRSRSSRRRNCSTKQ